MRLYDQQSGDDLRFALNNPDLLSPADIAKRDSMAERFNTSYGMADAGFDDFSQEARIADARKVQADAWVQEAPENAAFLAEDGDKLMAVYDSLVENGLLDEQDMSRNYAQDVADSGSGWGDTVEIARLNAEVVELGQRFLNGKQGDMETFRAEVAEVYGKLNAYLARRKDPTGFYGFVEQMYRMGMEDVPHVLYRVAESAPYGAAAGAVVGTVMGSAVPFIGNLTGAVGGSVAGALAGAKAGVVRGMYEAAQRGEEANFAVQMLMQKDDAGQYLDENTVREMARLYGMGSAAIETASDLVTAKILSPVLKTVGAKMGGLPAKLVAKDAMKAAVQHQSIKPVLMGVAKSMGAGALAEGAEEAVQEGLSSQVEAWAKNWLNDQGKNYFHDVEQGLLGSETWGDMARAGFEGAKVGLWFHLLPGVTKLYLDSQDVARARTFADKHKAVAQKVAESETAQLSPSRMETFLQSKGLNQTVLIPADAAWQMQQEGVDIVGAFGWRSETLEEAAAMGQDVAVSAARLHARFHSQPEVMNTLCDIMREKPTSMNALEAMDEGILADDVDAINEAMEEWQFSQNMIDAEMDRLRSILKPAILSIPELRRQILGVVDADTSVSSYIDAILAQIAGNAQYIAVHGGDGAGYISGLKIQGLVDALEGYGVGKVSPEERMEQEEMAAQAEADRPFWDNVWGMLDADSLKRDFPEARQELAKLHGRGLFAKKGEGIAVDELADMLKNAGWLDKDADSSTLVEMLKSKKRPKGRSLMQMMPAEMFELVATAETKLAQDVAAWDKVVSGVGEEVTTPQLMLRQTPLVLHMLGAHFREIYAAPHVFDGVVATKYGKVKAQKKGKKRKTLNVHKNITEDILKQIPAAMTDPIAIFASETVPGRLVFMLDVRDDAGATVVLPIELDAQKDFATIHLATSAYAKNNQNGEPDNSWFERQAKNLVYVNTKKEELWNSSSGSNSLWDLSKALGKENIRTEADLVKLKELFPGYYQRGSNIIQAASVEPDTYLDPKYIHPINDVVNEEAFEGLVRRFNEEGGFAPNTRPLLVLQRWGEYYALTGSHRIHAAAEAEIEVPAVVIKWDKKYQDEFVDLFEANDDWPRLKALRKLHELGAVSDDALLLMEAEDESNDMGFTLFQRAWHGTPYDFDAFTLQAIGSGEGAQAHGWGLYFAQNKNVSDDYRKKLAGRHNGAYEVTIGGEKPGDWLSRQLNAAPADALQQAASGDVEALKQAVQRMIDGEWREYNISKAIYDEVAELIERARNTPKLSISGFLKTVPESQKYRFKMWADYAKKRAALENRRATGQDFLASMDEFASSLRKGHEDIKKNIEAYEAIEWDKVEVKAPNRGQLFEVEIPDNDVLLDEQKSFEDQPEKVKKALMELFPEYVEERLEAVLDGVRYIWNDRDDAWMTEDGGYAPDSQYEELGKRCELYRSLPKEWTGKQMYGYLYYRHGSPRAASEAMNAVGIKGITYVGGQDGRCFVVFDDQAIQILDKLYQEQASYAAGATTPLEEGYFIQLFKGANLSTLSHELTHAMYLEMERLEREGLADERMLEDLATIRSWTAHMDDDANLKAEYDKRIRPRSDFGMEFDQLTPEMKAIARAIAKQEMVARGFEQYLREGNAPTPKLEGVFRRFAKWLKRVYKTALMLDVELNDEVRDVFDRWMASDEDIQAAAVNANIRDESGTVLDSLGVQGADRLELEHLIHEAKEKASDALRRDRAAKLRESVKAWREEAEAEVAADPVYAAREAMRREPLDLDAIVDAYGQDAAAKLMKKVPASLKKGGANPEALAFDYGFRNAGEMLKAIEEKPGKRERIQEIVKQKREDADAQFSAEDYLFEQDALADQQEKIGEILYRLELEGKTQGGKPVQPEQQDYEDFKSHARALRVVGREQIKTVAEKHLDELEVAKAIRPDLFRAAAARLMREERAAILAKDWRAAMEANYKARLNIELARQAAERRDIMESLTSKAKRFLKSKETDVNARFAIFVLSQNIQLFPATMKMLADAGDKTIANVRQFLNEMKEAGYYTIDAEIDESLFTGGAAAWRVMRWGKGLQPYVDAMTTIMHMERESRKANSEAAKQSWNEQMDALEASIRSFYPNAPTSPSAQHESGLLHWLKKFHAEHLKADTIALVLDGDRSFGPVWKALIQPINRATWKKTERMREESRRLKELFGAYSHNELMHMKGDRIFIDAIGEPLTKEQMIACALNCGNEENMQRLMDGFNWNRDQLQAVLDMLDERDWRFVQGVWDYLESFRKESFDLEEKLSGVRPKAIEAKPLQTKYGTLRGGYYPAVYDPRKTSRAIDPESVGTQTSGTNAVVDHGSMKQRTATGLKAPLKLDLGVIPSHVEKTVHMLAFREPVRSVGRVLNDRRVNNAIQSALGVEVANALGDWLKYVAGERPARSSIGDVAGWMRKNSALFTMGFKLSTMLMQVTGYLATIAELGPKWSSIGVMKVYGSGSPLAAYNMAMELSPMMRSRMQSIDRDVFEASTKLLEEGSRYPVADQLLRFRAGAEKYAFKGMGVVQMFAADLPTWHGAFAKGMEEWNDKQKAAEYADMVVERTQVGGADKDLAGMQTGGKYGELGKLATQFYSYFSALYQLFTRRTNALRRSEWKGPAEWWRLGTLALLTWCLEPALQSLMPNSGPDDDEEWLRWWGREVAFQPFNMVIGVRDVANMYKSRMEGYSGSFRPSPSLDTFNAIGRFSDQIVNVFQGECDTKKLVMSGGKALGLTTGLVNAQELLILEEFWDWLDGTNPDFELADLIRRKKK